MKAEEERAKEEQEQQKRLELKKQREQRKSEQGEKEARRPLPPLPSWPRDLRTSLRRPVLSVSHALLPRASGGESARAWVYLVALRCAR